MAPLMNYLGLGSSYSPPSERRVDKKPPARALPSAWYTSPEMFQLERRAIFSRKWLFMTHSSRLQNTGDFLRYNIAGYDFVLARDRKDRIGAFHNVCRHRAYSVVEESEGNKKILACRYHGWSYGLDGKLAKAPDYDQIEGFERLRNGLLPIHTHIDRKGFIWVNLDSRPTPEVAWEEDFAQVDDQKRFKNFKFEDYVFDHKYELDTNYNWKIASDNFNECYHCKTTHPDVPTFMTIDSHDVAIKAGHMQHNQAASPEQKAQGYDVNSTYYFPHASMSISPHFMMIQKFMAQGPSKTCVSYEVFRNKTSSDEQFKTIADIYARVMKEDKVLCEGVQKNLNSGVLINGELHSRWEKGPLFFQQSVREVITEHFGRERETGREIWPARQILPEDATVTESDLEICTAIGCGVQKDLFTW